MKAEVLGHKVIKINLYAKYCGVSMAAGNYRITLYLKKIWIFTQGPESAALPELLVYLQKVVTWMLDMLVGLPKKEQAEYLDFSGWFPRRTAVFLQLSESEGGIDAAVYRSVGGHIKEE